MTTAVIPEVAAVGGVFAATIADIERFTEPNRPLKVAGQRAIAALLKRFSEFNTPADVSMLVDLVAYYGLAPKHLSELTNDIVTLGLQNIYVAVEYGETVSPDTYKTGVKSVHTVASMLARIEEATGQRIETAEGLHAFIETVGGFKRACSLEADAIIEVLGAAPLPKWEPMSDADYVKDNDWDGDSELL